MIHDELRRSLASYVLGALSPVERREVDEHLPACAACRDELASYAVVPGLLSRLSLDEAADGTLLPPPTLLPSVLAAVEAERTGRRRQLARWRTASAALLAAAAVAGVLVVATGAPSAPDRPLVAAPGAPSSGSSSSGVVSAGTVSLQERPWGTELRLRLRDLPAADGFEAYAVDAAGVRTLAASWGPTAEGRADVPAATALSPDALAQVVVQTSSGDELLVLRT